MTARRDADRLIVTWLTETAPEGHVDYLDETLAAIDRLSQRPAWTSPGRWLPMQLTLPRVVLPRAAPYLAALALLLILAIAVVAITSGQRRLPPPFGLTATGLVAFASEGDILASPADGQGRLPLVSGTDAAWSPIWSHRGDQLAYWTAPAVGDPASLWVADGDGSNARLVTGTQSFGIPDHLPALAWSPDDQRLAFASEPTGALYVVNADGSDLRPIGDDSHERHDPVWSPDGTLIAYRGRPHGDPYTTMSSWVITPDGRTDVPVIDYKSGYGFTNTNPSWSLDSNAIIVMTAGVSDLDISEARRDASGAWSERVVIGGPTDDNHPAWSSSGLSFSFLRVVRGTNPLELELMVADADGSNVRRVSPARLGYAPQCWSPDDRFIRAVGPSETEPTVLLIPLDGSPAVEIPVPEHASRGACAMQRVAN